jgi:hypothetical protein
MRKDGDTELVFIALPILVEAVCVTLFIACAVVWLALGCGA